MRWTDRLYPDGTWEANLFQFYQRVWPKLAAGLPTPFRLEGAERRDVTPAHEALREAFVNALIHADYAASGGVVVERHPDRFLIANPGTLLVSVEQYQRGGVSECRNKAIQTMFLMIGGGERAGSGVDKIRSGWRAHHWRSPRLDVRVEPDRVALTMPMISLIPEDTLARLRARFGTAVDARPAGELQALATADIEGSVSNARLQELMTDHPVEITRMLARLCDEGLLVSDNRRRWTTYRLQEGSSSPHSEKSSSHSGVSSSHSNGSSSHLDERPNAGREKPIDLNALRKTAGPVATRRRVPLDAMRAMISRLCAGRYLTLAELADLLNRTPANLRNRHIAQMLTDGHLRARFPDKPNHPEQAYTTTGTDQR